ncbi:conserved protein, unknown function [Hepatocystis sp. ex Piliocolobus tephrosceles]|nr:conserved protein, unknown function [Hepatocystis sp. ex Piliocolobus tephrosceles]
MILNYIFSNKKYPKYENKKEIVKKDDSVVLQSCFKNVSITFILFGSIMFVINFLINIFYIDILKYYNVYKLFATTSGIWLIIIAIQMISFIFSSKLFESTTELLLRDEKRDIALKWDSFTTKIFVAFSSMSMMSFYGIFSYIINTTKMANEALLAIVVFSYAMNLIFVFLQFVHVLLKIISINTIQIGNYLVFTSPVLTCMLDLISARTKLILKKALVDTGGKKKKKHQQSMDHIMYPGEKLYLIEDK